MTKFDLTSLDRLYITLFWKTRGAESDWMVSRISITSSGYCLVTSIDVVHVLTQASDVAVRETVRVAKSGGTTRLEINQQKA